MRMLKELERKDLSMAAGERFGERGDISNGEKKGTFLMVYNIETVQFTCICSAARIA